MAPRVTRRTVAEIDREFDELTYALSDPREQLITSGERTSRLRPRASRADNTSDHLDSDEAMDENIQINAAAHNTEDPAKKSGRKVTTNDQLRKRRAKGNNIDIKFPNEFAKVCGEHASLFKCEITVLKRRNQNSINRGKQEMGSKVGTRSIAQIAYDPTKLQEAARIHQEKISSTPVSIVEHFALVLGRKPNHSCGVGIRSINRVAEERIKLQAQIEASEQHEAAAQARADAVEQRAEAAEQQAQALEGQVSTVVETNAHLQEEQQSQRDELTSLRQAHSGEVARLVREQLDNQMAELIARIHSGAS
ncbi:unnamed protein product [Miscanthus lutarioriparius]|uniref:Uncharacterized protein n=1 Tax=Miscanthus lutarioriparius TaxID=422564 RepID=A0A811N1G7_9POAL|nr:unnamed protein product [Miscanthus lutarioriparius]